MLYVLFLLAFLNGGIQFFSKEERKNNTILQASMTGIETLLNKPCAVVTPGNVRGFIPLEFTGAATYASSEP